LTLLRSGSEAIFASEYKEIPSAANGASHDKQGVGIMRDEQRTSVLNLRRTTGVGPAAKFIVAIMLWIFMIPSGQAQTFSDLYDFTGSSDGGYLWGGVVRDPAGNLYGPGDEGGIGYGVVFKVDTKGNETVLHAFAGPPADGSFSISRLLRDKAGNLYGMTYYGGANDKGTVFKVDTKGNETVLYNFVGGTTDGCYPTGGLIRDASGNLYGTTSACGGGGGGTVFELSKSGETVLHSFTVAVTDGLTPAYGSLLMDKGGNLYGVTVYGGSFDRQFTKGVGTLYKLSSNGTFNVLHSFTPYGGDGYPMGTPVMDSAGNIYGTSYGCDPANCNGSGGTVWKWTNAGAYQVRFPFRIPKTQGSNPIDGVILDSKGNLYGDTYSGGTYDYGTVFQLRKNGSLTLLHSFSLTDGEYPIGGLTHNGVKSWYGTTQRGGTYGQGVVWSLQLALPQ
jgi:uncharacterized repeat protein (TIGR03803 family)